VMEEPAFQDIGGTAYKVGYEKYYIRNTNK
jgi:hypothetical protein